MRDRLKYISEAVLEDLLEHIPDRLDLYTREDFSTLMSEYGWNVEATGVGLIPDKLAELQSGATTPQVEVRNSLIVHEALPGMRRSVAREERVWVRLCHVECLNYARSRWLSDVAGEELETQIRTHFFASSLTQVRDDNAIGRLWWNAEIARIGSPDDIEHGLNMILKTADIRLNLVERPRLMSRPVLARGVVRALADTPWLTEKEENFRRFMRTLNRDGSGVLYEVLSEAEAVDLIDRVVEKAQKSLAADARQA